MNYQKYYKNLFLKKGKTDKQKILSVLKELSFKKTFLIFHVGGTNGKGSLCNYLMEGFSKKYSQVGVFTSPHLVLINERIKINNNTITDEEFYEYSKKIIKIYPDIPFFNLIYIISMLYFQDNKIDIALIEVGIGGRNDVTNSVHGEYGVITNVSLDHTKILGNTLERIAKDKAGIINKNMKYFIPSILNNDLKTIFQDETKLKNAEFININIKNNNYKKQNISLAKGILNYLNIKTSSIKWETPIGRTTIIKYKRTTHIIDVAHNLDGINMSLKYLKDKKIRFNKICLSLSKDKNIDLIFKLLNKFNNIDIYVYQNSGWKALKINEYKFGKRISNINKFLGTLKETTLFIGSFYFIADVLEVINA